MVNQYALLMALYRSAFVFPVAENEASIRLSFLFVCEELDKHSSKIRQVSEIEIRKDLGNFIQKISLRKKTAPGLKVIFIRGQAVIFLAKVLFGFSIHLP